MKTYKFKLVETRTAYVEVKAENVDDARELAERIGNGSDGATYPEWDDNTLIEVTELWKK